MLRKHVSALVIAVLLALTLTLGPAPSATLPTALAMECGSTTGGGG